MNRYLTIIKYAWKMLFDNAFRFWLWETIFFAWSQANSGKEGASNVHIFWVRYSDIQNTRRRQGK